LFFYYFNQTKSVQNVNNKRGVIKMRRMDRILPIIASVGVGIAAYQMMSGNGGKMKNMLPHASNMMGMGSGIQGQDQHQSDNQLL
jgi:hypothetical protein